MGTLTLPADPASVPLQCHTNDEWDPRSPLPFRRTLVVFMNSDNDKTSPKMRTSRTV